MQNLYALMPVFIGVLQGTVLQSFFRLIPSLLISSALLSGCNTTIPENGLSPTTAAGVAAYQRGHYDVALFALEPRADAGDREAQFRLGLMYVDDIWAVRWRGQTSDKRRAKGIDFLEKAAEQGHLAAQLRLGTEYLRSEKYQNAEKWYLAAVSQEPENKEANFGLGQVYRKSKRIEEAKVYYQKAADKQHLDAIFWLAWINGDEDMLREAADKFHIQSSLHMGRIKYKDALEYSRNGNTKAYSQALREAEKYLRQIAHKNTKAKAQLATLLKTKEEAGHSDAKRGEWESWAYRAAKDGYISSQLDFLLKKLLDSKDYMQAADLVLKIAQLDSKRWDDYYEEPIHNYTMVSDDGATTYENHVVDARMILAVLLGGDQFQLEDWGIPYNDWREFLNLSPGRDDGYFWLFLAEKHVDSKSKYAESMREKVNETGLAKHDEIEKLVDQWKPKFLRSRGSGFFLRNHLRNHVITAQHVIDDCDEIRVSLHKAEKEDIVHESAESDLAVLQIAEHKRRYRGYLEANYLSEIGETIYTFGYPDGQEYWVDGLLYDAQTINSAEFFYHTAPTNPGHSGGPILDRFGRVIGVASSTFSVVNDHILKEVQKEGVAAVVQGKFKASWIGNILSFFMDKDAEYVSQLWSSVGDGTTPAPHGAKIREKAKKYTVPITCWKNN